MNETEKRKTAEKNEQNQKLVLWRDEQISGIKEGAYTICDSMDGTGEHYAKWNKPGSEGQIPYDLTFNWNIVNRRKKQTKYNQRHWS